MGRDRADIAPTPAPTPTPNTLEALLRERLYPRAPVDERPAVRIALAADAELRAVLRSHASALQATYTSPISPPYLPYISPTSPRLQAIYEAACAHGDGGGGGGGGCGGGVGGGGGAAAGVSASAVVALLRDKVSANPNPNPDPNPNPSPHLPYLRRCCTTRASR